MSESFSVKGYGSPCQGCVPPERNAECHATCKRYLEWKAERNRINQARLDYEDSIRYISQAAIQMAKRNKKRK